MKSNGASRGRDIVVGVNDLTTTHPKIAAQWHPTLNHPKTPEMVTAGSNIKVWWVDDDGHEWDSVISSRAGKKPVGCRICSGKQVLTGFNDLAHLHPNLIQFWHPSLNDELTPQTILAGSKTRVWWQCSKGHAFEDSPMKRITAAQPCPVCINKRCLTGVNDVATLYPHLLEEWDLERNTGEDLHALVPGSGKSAWWKCSLGHSWSAPIRVRTQKKTGCLYCSGQRTLAGFNDLASQLPELAAQWHPTKNGELSPDKVHNGARESVWWQCSKGHEWKGSIYDRKLRQSGCPYCSGRYSVVGVTDLLTTHTAIASEWHPTKNGDLLPSQISAGAGSVKIWWLGKCGHEWETYSYNRKAGKGCPSCSNNTSKAELEICEYIQSLIPNEEVRSGDKKLLKGKELDIYIPSKKIAVEFNGLYWHTETQGKGKTYHYEKWLECKEKGVQLIQVWEDEWNRNPEQIKQMIAHKLGCSNQKKVFARKTKVTTVTVQKMQEFLSESHVQGFASGSYYLGLVERNDETETLLAALVLKKEPKSDGKVLNIIRYATNASVIGGFTKLLKYAEKQYKPESFITFADHCVSDGGLYENNGFVADKELPPDYTYLVNRERKHKFGYRITKFQNDPNLLWEEGMTERELADLNGLPRIWDAGKTRYCYTV